MKKIIRYFKRIWSNECTKCGLVKIDWRGINSCPECDFAHKNYGSIGIYLNSQTAPRASTKALLNLKRNLEETNPNSDGINVIVTELKRRHKQA